jgi:hypothetical protein
MKYEPAHCCQWNTQLDACVQDCNNAHDAISVVFLIKVYSGIVTVLGAGVKAYSVDSAR